MNIIFRLDASKNNGIGHLIRCKSLASSLINRGAKAHFIMRYLDMEFKKFLKMRKCKVTILPKRKIFSKLDHENLWPKRLQKIDAIDTKKIISNKEIDLLVIDHYGLNSIWEKALTKKAKKIMVISDYLNRRHSCDFFLNQNIVKEQNLNFNQNLPKKCKILLGPKYSLIDKSYANYRKNVKIKNKLISKVFISFGGSETPKLLEKVIESFDCNILRNLRLIIVSNNELKKFPKIKKNFYKKQKTLTKLINKSDFCIGAGGISTWERMCLGKPSLVFSISKNQVQICKDLKNKNLIYYVKGYKNIKPTFIRKKIISIIKNIKLFNEKKLNNIITVDGLGVSRVTEILYPSFSKDLKLRKTILSDMINYYNWVNEKDAIKSSFNNKQVHIKKHIKWFKKQIMSKKTLMFVLEAKRLPVGQIRFNLTNKNANIDYSLDKIVRGRNWGKKIIDLGLKKINFSKFNAINAEVKKNNYKSISVFNKLGFTQKFFKNKYFYSLYKKNYIVENDKI